MLMNETFPPQTFLERARVLVSQIAYKDGWKLLCCVDRMRNDAIFIRWRFEAKNVKTGIVETMRGRKWYLSQYMTDSEIVCTAFKAALTAEEHECRENFTFQDSRIFNPHIDVHILRKIADAEDVRL